MNALTKLIAVYNNKSESAYHKLVEQMLLHAQQIPQMSIYELAEICYSSTTAISRFVRRLEYGNFHLFKSALANTLNYYPQYNRKMPLSARSAEGDCILRYTSLFSDCLHALAAGLDRQSIVLFTEGIAQAGQLIFAAPSAYGFSSFQYDLFLQGKVTLFSDNYTDSERDIAQADSRAFVLFFVPPERESGRTERLICMATERDAQIGIVARADFALQQRTAPLCLTYESTGSDMDDRLLCHIMDLLILTYRTQYIDRLQ